jgi:hypothetical protein
LILTSQRCAVWFFSASFGGTVLNKIGPAITGFLGVIGYMVYVGSLWYFDQVGKQGFPIAAGVLVGISSGLIFVTMGYIANSYSEEQNRGQFITVSINLQATGSIVGSIIPLIINRDSVSFSLGNNIFDTQDQLTSCRRNQRVYRLLYTSSSLS